MGSHGLDKEFCALYGLACYQYVVGVILAWFLSSSAFSHIHVRSIISHPITGRAGI